MGLAEVGLQGSFPTVPAGRDFNSASAVSLRAFRHSSYNAAAPRGSTSRLSVNGAQSDADSLTQHGIEVDVDDFDKHIDDLLAGVDLSILDVQDGPALGDFAAAAKGLHQRPSGPEVSQQNRETRQALQRQPPPGIQPDGVLATPQPHHHQQHEHPLQRQQHQQAGPAPRRHVNSTAVSAEFQHGLPSQQGMVHGHQVYGREVFYPPRLAHPQQMYHGRQEQHSEHLQQHPDSHQALRPQEVSRQSLHRLQQLPLPSPPPPQLQQEPFQQPQYTQQSAAIAPNSRQDLYQQRQQGHPPYQREHSLHQHQQIQQLQAASTSRRSHRHSRSISGPYVRPLAVSHVAVGGSIPGAGGSQPWLSLSNHGSSASASGGCFVRLVRSKSLIREPASASGALYEHEPTESSESLALAQAQAQAGLGLGSAIPGWGVPEELEAQLDSMLLSSAPASRQLQQLPSGQLSSHSRPQSQQMAALLASPSRGMDLGVAGASGPLSTSSVGGLVTCSAGPAGALPSPAAVAAATRLGAHSSGGGAVGMYDMSGMAAAGVVAAPGMVAAVPAAGISGGFGRSRGARDFGVPVAPLKMKRMSLASPVSQELLRQLQQGLQLQTLPEQMPSPLPPSQSLQLPSPQAHPLPLVSPSGSRSCTLDTSSGSFPRPHDILASAQLQHHQQLQAQLQVQHQEMMMRQARCRSLRRAMSSAGGRSLDGGIPVAGGEFHSQPLVCAPTQPTLSLKHAAQPPQPDQQPPIPSPFARMAQAPPEAWSGPWQPLAASAGVGSGSSGSAAAAAASAGTSTGQTSAGDSGAGSTAQAGGSGQQPAHSAEGVTMEAEQTQQAAPEVKAEGDRTAASAGASLARPAAGEEDAQERAAAVSRKVSGVGETEPDSQSQSHAAAAAAAVEAEAAAAPAPSPRGGRGASAASDAGGSRAAPRGAGAAAAAAAPAAAAAAAASTAAKGAAAATKAGKPRQRARASGTLADVLRLNLLAPGPHQLLVGNQDTVDVVLHSDGRIETPLGEFRSLSSMALAVLRRRNPSRLACDGWQEVKLNGTRLDELRREAGRLLALEASAGGVKDAGE